MCTVLHELQTLMLIVFLICNVFISCYVFDSCRAVDALQCLKGVIFHFRQCGNLIEQIVLAIFLLLCLCATVCIICRPFEGRSVVVNTAVSFVTA